MVSLETLQATAKPDEPISGPRISFSAESLDENDFITITPNIHQPSKHHEKQRDKSNKTRSKEFEFLSSNNQKMLSADELFFEGKLLPFWQMQQAEKLDKMTLKTRHHAEEGAAKQTEDGKKEENRMNRFLDDDPSPRLPTCTVLWKELLRLKKQRASKQRASSTLSSSPSSSSSSSSSWSSSSSYSVSTAELAEEGNGENNVKQSKKTLERTRSASIRIRPAINVPIFAQGKSNGLPPLFSFRKGKLER